MKKLLPILLALVLLTGCGHKGSTESLTTPDHVPATTAPETSEPETTPEPTQTTEPETTPVPETTVTEATTEPTTVTTTEPTTVTTTEATTVTTTEATTVTTTKATTVTTTEATTVTTTKATTVTTTEATTVTTTEATTAATEAPKTELMDSIKIEEFCPSSASDRRNGVTYPRAEHKTYRSKTTGLDRGVNIVLPAGYDSSKKYPVIYMLHGIFCDEYTFINDPAYRLIEICTNLAKDGLAEDMIIVFPNIYAKTDSRQEPSFNDISSVAPYDNFINDLVNDLMPFIEKNYSVKTGRDNTAVAGFSMGGREALFIGFERPDLFGYCGAFSPAPGLTPMRDWAFDHPGQYKESELTFAGKDYTPELLLISGGTKDGTVGDTYKKYDTIMTRNSVKHICYDITGADHDANAVNSGFYNFVKNIFK